MLLEQGASTPRCNGGGGAFDPRQVPLFGGRIAAFGTCDVPNSLVCLEGGRGVVALDPWGPSDLVAARYDGAGALTWSRRISTLFAPAEYEAFSWYSSKSRQAVLIRRWITKGQVAVLFERAGLAPGHLRLDIETGERSAGDPADILALYRLGSPRDRELALAVAVHNRDLEGLGREAWSEERSLTPTARVCAAAIQARAGGREQAEFLRQLALGAAGEKEEGDSSHEACKAALLYLHEGLPREEADGLVLAVFKQGTLHSTDALLALAARGDLNPALDLLVSVSSLAWAEAILEEMKGHPWGNVDNEENLFRGLASALATSPNVSRRRMAAFLLGGGRRDEETRRAVSPGLQDSSAEVRAAAAMTLVASGGQGEPYLQDFADSLRSADARVVERSRAALAATGEEMRDSGKQAPWVLAYAWWREILGGLGLALVWFGLARRFPRHRAASRLGLGINLAAAALPPVLLAAGGLWHVVSQPWAANYVPETFGALVVPPPAAVALALAFACLCGGAAACLTKPLAPAENPS